MTVQARDGWAIRFRDGAASLRPVEIALIALSLALSALAFGPTGAAVNAAVLVPVTIGMATWRLIQAHTLRRRGGSRATPLRDMAIAVADRHIAEAEATGKSTACLLLSIDAPAVLAQRYGREALETALARTMDRIDGALRETDSVTRLEDARFAVVLAPSPRLNLETLIQISSRLQSAIAAPISVDATSLYITASCGFALLSRVPTRSGQALFHCAEQAAEEAQRNGAGTVRAWSVEIARETAIRSSLRESIATALEDGQIIAHYQPQLSTDTGEVAGFEVLARWQHPERGMIQPAEFLPVIHAAGLSERLGEVMVFHALTSLRAWDRAGLRVPRVAVNMSRDELCNPRIADRLKWELDRFEISPHRLTIEILESVAADSSDDVIIRNVAALAGLGCQIDLDDFGVGNASIAQLRRFVVHRLKIDRSFVTHIDTDAGQRRMVSAILSMAEQLGLETVAEGIESLGENAILSQLGCTYVQGFAIARPMPFEETIAWAERHAAKLSETPRIERKAG
jgi:diguanylate cyclase (GGDEF)-like protein